MQEPHGSARTLIPYIHILEALFFCIAERYNNICRVTDTSHLNGIALRTGRIT